MTGNKYDIYPKRTGAELNAEVVSQPGVSTDINREYKDRLFKFLFGNPEHKDWTLSLYNAVNGTFYEDPDDISFTTINDTVYMSMKNDVSFLIANTMNFYEQQSTYNPNMPIRFLVYAGMVYSAYIDNSDHDINIFSGKQQMLPVARCICFYNGTREQPDQKVLQLADAFAFPEHADISLNVTMLNINSGRNQKLMAACPPLREYAELVESIRQAWKTLQNLGAAVDYALDSMPDDSLIKPLITTNKAEVRRMFLTEYDEAATMEKFRREYLSEGDRQRMESDAKGMYAEGIRLDTIARVLKTTVEDVESILGLEKA